MDDSLGREARMEIEMNDAIRQSKPKKENKMVYKPKILQGNFKRGDSGVATVKINGDRTKVKVVFEETGKEIISNEFPKDLRPGKWFITLDGDNKKVFAFRPVNGLFIGKVNKFVAREGETPAPQTHIGADWSYQYFTVLLEITKGENKGLSIPCMLRYHFAEAHEDEKSVVAFSHPKSKYTPMLIEFCDVTGVWEKGVMPYKDNILPYIEKRVLHMGKEFQFVMKGGWVDSFIPIDQPESETLPDEEEELQEDTAAYEEYS